MFVMAKENNGFFASTLNGITASEMCVVLNAELTRLIAAHANKKYSEKQRSPTRVPFFCLLKNINI